MARKIDRINKLIQQNYFKNSLDTFSHNSCRPCFASSGDGWEKKRPLQYTEKEREREPVGINTVQISVARGLLQFAPHAVSFFFFFFFFCLFLSRIFYSHCFKFFYSTLFFFFFFFPFNHSFFLISAFLRARTLASSF